MTPTTDARNTTSRPTRGLRRTAALLIITLGMSITLGLTARVAQASTYNTEHDFAATVADGQHPYGALVQDPATLDYYGTTRFGGEYGQGTVYAMDHKTFAVKVIHSFDGNDGANPTCALIVIPSIGNISVGPSALIGTTERGGLHGDGTVFSVATTGAAFNSIYSFKGGADGANPFAGVIRGATDGLLYGTTLSGGRFNLGTVYRINANGTDTVLHAFEGTVTPPIVDGATPYARLFQLGDGDLVGTAARGGNNNNGVVFRITTSGATYNLLHKFAGNADGSTPTAELIAVTDPATGFQLLYGTTLLGGMSVNGAPANLGTVYRLDQTGGTYSVIYAFGTNGAQDGQHPFGALLQVNNADDRPILFGTTMQGGVSGFGTVYAVTATSPSPEVVGHSFLGLVTDGATPYAALIHSTYDKLLYGTCAHDGTNQDGTVYQIHP
jgi:uncharacterized repeat protein (TIGR03803 family)